MNDEVRATGLDPARDRAQADLQAASVRNGPASRRVEVRRKTMRVPTTRAARFVPIRPQPAPISTVRPMPRSISAPTIAACWWRARPMTGSASSTRFRGSSGWARASRRPGGSGEPAIARAIEVLRICRDKMRNRGVTRSRLIATEACRLAENGDDFLDRVRRDVGIALEIVDRETEALLAATGCTPLVDPEAQGAILFDIGGGSSEIARLGRSQSCRRGPPEPAMQGWISLPVGVVTLAERHGGIR